MYLDLIDLLIKVTKKATATTLKTSFLRCTNTVTPSDITKHLSKHCNFTFWYKSK